MTTLVQQGPGARGEAGDLPYPLSFTLTCDAARQ
jgi:hypothetical protein